LITGVPFVSSNECARRSFINLPDEEKERIFRELDGKTHAQLLAESRPLNAGERARLARFKRGLGRPRKGEGSKAINVTVETGLLRRADAYAQRIAKGLELAVPKSDL
jgi:hypothetical protein